jgi:hypothetical protein
VKRLFYILTTLSLFSCIAEEKATNTPQIGDYRVFVETADQHESLYIVKEGCYRFARYIEIENNFSDKGLVRIKFEVSSSTDTELAKIRSELSAVPFVLKVDVKKLD